MNNFNELIDEVRGHAVTHRYVSSKAYYVDEHDSIHFLVDESPYNLTGTEGHGSTHYPE